MAIEHFIADIDQEAHKSGLSQKLWDIRTSNNLIPANHPKCDDTLEDCKVYIEQTVDMTIDSARGMLFVCLYLQRNVGPKYEVHEKFAAVDLEPPTSEMVDLQSPYGLRLSMERVDLKDSKLADSKVELSEAELKAIQNGLSKLTTRIV